MKNSKVGLSEVYYKVARVGYNKVYGNNDEEIDLRIFAKDWLKKLKLKKMMRFFKK